MKRSDKAACLFLALWHKFNPHLEEHQLELLIELQGLWNTGVKGEEEEEKEVKETTEDCETKLTAGHSFQDAKNQRLAFHTNLENLQPTVTCGLLSNKACCLMLVIQLVLLNMAKQIQSSLGKKDNE